MIRIAAWIAVAGLACSAVAQDKPAEKKSEAAQPKVDAKPDKPGPAGDPAHPIAKMVTSLGEIDIELDAVKAPISVQNFVTYAEEGFYNGTIFHRVISNFMIQGGGYTPDLEEKREGVHAPIKNEYKNGLKNAKYTIAMARLGGRPDSATNQFFINVADNVVGGAIDLDTPRDGAAYAVFGRVVGGTDVVEKIRTAAVQIHPKYPSGNQPVVPTEPIIIKSVTITGYDKSKIAAEAAKAEEASKAAAEAARLLKEKEVQDFAAKIEQETGKKFTKTPSGLMYITTKEGAGESPKPTDKVQVHYTGTFLDGRKFDSSVDKGRPLVHPANQFCPGWNEALPTMKVGEKRRMILPPSLGYGERGYGAVIPPNAWLYFELELLDINPKAP